MTWPVAWSVRFTLFVPLTMKVPLTATHLIVHRRLTNPVWYSAPLAAGVIVSVRVAT